MIIDAYLTYYMGDSEQSRLQNKLTFEFVDKYVVKMGMYFYFSEYFTNI